MPSGRAAGSSEAASADAGAGGSAGAPAPAKHLPDTADADSDGSRAPVTSVEVIYGSPSRRGPAARPQDGTDGQRSYTKPSAYN